MSAGADRGISQVVSGARFGGKRILGIALGVSAIGLLVLVNGLGKGTAGAPAGAPALDGGQRNEAAAGRGAAPPLELRTRSAVEEAGDIQDPCWDPAKEAAAQEPVPAPESAWAQEQQAELARQALALLAARRERDDRRRRASSVVFDEPVSRRGSVLAGIPGEAPPSPQAPQTLQVSALAPQRLLGSASASPGQPSPLGRQEQFARDAELEPVETIRAERIANPSTTVAQGTLILGVLETAIQSDLPGLVRAQVSDPVFSFTGALVVPRGSTLIGRYQSGLVQGQTRVFVIWSRLIRSDGVSIQLASPGTDVLGRAGVGGEVNTRFFERFRGALLLSLVDGALGIASAGAQNSEGATIVNAGGQQVQRAADLALQNSVNIPPTIEVARGTRIQVFVAKDLDFVESLGGEPIRREP